MEQCIASMGIACTYHCLVAPGGGGWNNT